MIKHAFCGAFLASLAIRFGHKAEAFNAPRWYADLQTAARRSQKSRPRAETLRQEGEKIAEVFHEELVRVARQLLPDAAPTDERIQAAINDAASLFPLLQKESLETTPRAVARLHPLMLARN